MRIGFARRLLNRHPIFLGAAAITIYVAVISLLPRYDFHISRAGDQQPGTVAVAAEKEEPHDIALALSGGGYRAMLFHLGALWRLNDAGYLPRLAAVSAVSGGSITAGVLGVHWKDLDFDNAGVAGRFSAVVDPLRTLASTTIDLPAVLWGILTPRTIPQEIAAAYRRYLYGHLTLQDLPDKPRLIFNATNLQSSVGWRFTKRYLGDYRVGINYRPQVELAVAVTASSAFPPVLAPAVFRVDRDVLEQSAGADLYREPYRTTVFLADGGVDDNLGLERIVRRYKTIFVSDAAGRARPDPRPQRNWLYTTARVLTVIYDQPGQFRKRQLIEAFVATRRNGVYFSIRSKISDYSAADKFCVDENQALELAEIPTRLAKLSGDTQKRLINFGYVMADAAIRSHFDGTSPREKSLPYPEAPLSVKAVC